MTKEYFSQKSPALSLHLSMFILQQKADELLSANVGAGLSQVRIMSQLHPAVARSQKTVALMLHQTEANVSRQLQSMKRQGLVKVVKNSRDRRVREVTLSAKGAKTYSRAERLLDKQYKDLHKLLKGTGFDSSVNLLSKSS